MSMSEFMTPMSSGRNSGQIVNKSMIYPTSKQKKQRPQTASRPVNLVPLAKKEMTGRMMSKTMNYGDGLEHGKNNSFSINPTNLLNPHKNQKASLSFSVSRKDKNHSSNNNSFNNQGISPSRSFTPEEQISQQNFNPPAPQKAMIKPQNNINFKNSKKNQQLLKVANHKALKQKVILLQVPEQWNQNSHNKGFSSSAEDQKNMKLTLLKDLEPILKKISDKIYNVKLGIQVTNVSDFSWPAGLTFKLMGLDRDEIAKFNLKTNVQPGENSLVIFEFTNELNLNEEQNSDVNALIRVLKLLDQGMSSDGGFNLKVKCSIPEKKLRFICKQSLDWEQFHINYEISGSQNEYQEAVEFSQE